MAAADLQRPFDTAVVIQTLLRPSLVQAVRSVFAQRKPANLRRARVQFECEKSPPLRRAEHLQGYQLTVKRFALGACFGSVSCSTPSTCFGFGPGRIDSRRQADRARHFAVHALGAKNLRIGGDFTLVFGADRHHVVVDLDLDLVLGDARQVGTNEKRFIGFFDVETDRGNLRGHVTEKLG